MKKLIEISKIEDTLKGSSILQEAGGRRFEVSCAFLEKNALPDT